MRCFKGRLANAVLVFALVGCGGGGGDDDGGPIPDNHAEDKSGCLNRYDAIKASMSAAALENLLGPATDKTYDGKVEDGKLLGMGWNGVSYQNDLKCFFLVGMDKKGAYSKGVSGGSFSGRSTLLRDFVPY